MIKRTISVSILLLICALLLSYGSYIKLGLLILICVAWFLGRKEHVWYNPFYLIIPTFVSFLLYSEYLNPFYTPALDDSTSLLITAALAMLLLGVAAMRKMRLKPVTLPRHDYNFWLIFLIGALPSVLAYALFGNTLDMSGEQLLDTKEKMSIPVLGQLAYFLPAAIIVACEKNRVTLILVAFVVGILAALLSVTKTAMLIAALFLAIGFTRFRPALGSNPIVRWVLKYKYVIIPIVVIYMVMYNNNTRQAASGFDSMYFLEGDRSSSVFGDGNFAQNLHLDYCYLCTSWQNFEYNKGRMHYPSGGALTFEQLAKKTGTTLNPPTKQIANPPFNTFSYMTDFYLDFGAAGLLALSFLLGCLIYFIYVKCGLSNDPLMVSYYALIAYATFMLFFNNHFTNGYLLNYLITFGGYIVVARSFSR